MSPGSTGLERRPPRPRSGTTQQPPRRVRRAADKCGMSVEELLSLPVSFALWPTAAKAINVGRSQVYDLAARDELPFPVLKIGRTLRVTRADLLRSLGMDPNPTDKVVA